MTICVSYSFKMGEPKDMKVTNQHFMETPI